MYRVPDKWFSLRIPACNEAEVLNRSWWVALSLAFWALTSFQIRYGYRYFTTSDVTFALPKLVLQSAWTNKTEDVLRHIVVYYTIHNFQYTEFYDRSANFSSLCVAFFFIFFCAIFHPLICARHQNISFRWSSCEITQFTEGKRTRYVKSVFFRFTPTVSRWTYEPMGNKKAGLVVSWRGKKKWSSCLLLNLTVAWCASGTKYTASSTEVQ